MSALVLPLASSAISYFQAIVLGVLQGVTELFPISSLGHTVLFPTLFGWNGLVKAQSESESFWLAFIVMLHVGSALGLLVYYWSDWVEIVGAFFHTLSTRRAESANERLAWLIVIASIPAGVIGLALEHELRTLETMEYREAFVIGAAQSTALVAGISRDGVTMGAGLARGLDHSDAARFAFLLATPVILAAGLVKLPELLGHHGDGVRGQALVACVAAGVTAFFTVRFLVNYFKTKTLIPFAVYCLAFGAFMLVYTLA
jgi:undecaprenyl-diphosphatase